MNRLRLGFGLAAFALAGCTFGPDYARPTLDTPEAYRWQTADAEPGSFGDLGWWQVYADPTLQELIETAAAQNLDVRIAVARIEQAEATLGSSRLAQLPQISASAGETRTRASQRVSSFSAGERTVDTVQLGASWEIDLWGRLRRATEAGRADLLAARYAQQGVVVTLVGDVATAYFNLQTLDEQLAITRRTVATREKFVELTHARHDSGVVSGLDVATAEAQLATAQANIPDLERQIAQGEDGLSILLGGNPGSIARDPSALDLPAPVPATGLPSALVDRRPDLRQAEAALIAANARVGVAKAALFPTLSLTGAVGSSSSALDGLFTGPAEIFSIGGNLLLPLLDAQRNLFQVDLADARKREAILQYRKVLLGAFRDVSDALIARQKNAEFEQAQAAQVTALRRADEIALARYRIGFSSYFDVINAERDLFGAELALSAAKRNTRIASVQLYRALGGGWQADSRNKVKSPSPGRSAETRINP